MSKYTFIFLSKKECPRCKEKYGHLELSLMKDKDLCPSCFKRLGKIVTSFGIDEFTGKFDERIIFRSRR